MFLDEFICGRCARKEGYTIDERKEMAMEMEQGENECSCGRTIVLNGYRVTVVDKKHKSVLE